MEEIKKEAPKRKRAPRKKVRMKITYKQVVSYCEVPESEVEAHEKAGWTRG